MAKTTAKLLLPYPEDGEAPDGPVQLKALAERIETVLYAPSCRATRTSALSVNNVTSTLLQLNGEEWDTDSMHSTSSNTERLIAPKDGLYVVEGTSLWEMNAELSSEAPPAFYETSLWRNTEKTAIDAVGMMVARTERRFGQNFNFEVRLKANDYVFLRLYQDSGKAASVRQALSEANSPTQAGLRWVRPYPS